MKISRRARRIVSVLSLLIFVAGWLIASPKSYETTPVEDQTAEPLGISTEVNSQSADAQDTNAQNADTQNASAAPNAPRAADVLTRLEIKGRAPKTGYARTEFYKSWPSVGGCSLRQVIIKRELGDSARLADNGCDMISGEFVESYTGSKMVFYQKSDFSDKIQIDHIVALSDAWQKGAQNKTKEERYQMATDPLNLIAVDASANKQKSDGDAATWLPPNKPFRCQYVARQVSVKYKYGLWVSQAEHDIIKQILETCPNEPAVGVEL